MPEDVPVPTIPAGSVFEKGFLCVIAVTKETENTMKLTANNDESSLSSKAGLEVLPISDVPCHNNMRLSDSLPQDLCLTVTTTGFTFTTPCSTLVAFSKADIP